MMNELPMSPAVANILGIACTTFVVVMTIVFSVVAVWFYRESRRWK